MVTLIESDGGWSPDLSLDDAAKVEAVSLALKRADIEAAMQLGGRVSELRDIPALTQLRAGGEYGGHSS